MGGGSSTDKPRTPSPQSDRPIKRQNTIRSVNLPLAPSPKLLKKDTLQQPQQDQQTRLKWPLPHAKEENAFIPNDVEDKAQYSFRRSRYERGTPAVRRSIKITTVNFPYSQRAETKKSDYVESDVFQSAHVQMTMKTKTDLWAGMTVSAEMKNLMARLNVAHMQSNEIIQQRLDGVSKEAERVIGLIIKETTDEQDRLLKYAQEAQRTREELHRQWLQKYVIELDRWRSKELGKLHEKLEYSKKEMNTILQKKLALVNHQVDVAKSEIFREEQERQAEEAGNIVSDVNEISQKDKMQHIGTEANTDIYLKIRANAGNKVDNENKVIRENPKSNDPYYPYLEHEHLDRMEFENEY